MIEPTIIEEKKPSKVGASFESVDEARQAANELRQTLDIDSLEIHIVTPADETLESALEPEARGVKRTMFQAHKTMGYFGIGGGVILYLLLTLFDVSFISASPLLSLLVLAAVGGFIGLLVGGLITLRPDHDPLIHFARKAHASKQSLVLVHAETHHQKKLVKMYLRHRADHVISTL